VTPETAAIRGDIEQTRAEMSGTIDAIQDKLDPEVLQEQAKDTIREAKEAAIEVADHTLQQAKEALRGATIGKVEDMARYAGDTAGGWRHTFVETVKAHPIPAALAGLSLGYLFLNRESSPMRTTRHGGVIDARDGGYRSREDYGVYPRGESGAYGTYRAYDGGNERDADSVTERAGALAGQAKGAAGQALDRAQERTGQAVDRVQDAAGQATEQVQDAAGHVAEQVQEQAHRAQSFLGRQLEENPLAVGAVAAVIGGALAASMGTTPREDRVFGTTRDRFMGRAQEMTQDTLQQVGHKVERVVDEVKDTAGRAADEIKSTAEREARAQDLLPEGSASGGASGPSGGARGSTPTGS
jgi:ElaB/YqjD/DUF883 family membrane-anchored ribosome-binding protein